MSKIIFNGVDYAGGSGNYFNPVIYSDVERKVGVWRDNKPLYQKTWLVPKSSLNSGETTYTHNDDLHIDNLVSVEGTVGNSRPLVEYHSNSAWACSIYNIGNNAFWIYLGSSVYSNLANTSYVKVTLRYTKTTDVAGSGDYNTYGVPTVHYSTSEQVIGTWTDGKPLYKKTYQFNSTVWLNANGWTNGINVDTTNVKVLVDAEVLRTIGAYSFYGYLQVVPYNNLLNIFNCRNTNMEIDTITLVYTKTTD